VIYFTEVFFINISVISLKSFLAKGVSRITSIGHMANFTFPWDDIFPTEKLIRWCYA